MGAYLLRREDVFAVQFEMDAALRLPVAVQTTLGNGFPFLNSPLLLINDKPCPNTIEALKIELLCSGAWPVRLVFGDTTVPKDVDGLDNGYQDNDGNLDESEEDEEEEPASNEPVGLQWSFAALEENSCTREELSGMEAGGSVPPNVMGSLMRFVLLKGHSESHSSAAWTMQSPPDLYAILGKRKQANTAFVILPYQLQNSSRWAMAWLCLLRGSVLVVFNLGGAELDGNFQLLLNGLNHRKYDTVSLPHYLPPAATQRDEDTGYVIMELTARLVKYRQFKNLDAAKQAFALEQQRASALDQDTANRLREKVCGALKRKNNLDALEGAESADLPELPGEFPLDTAAYRDLWALFELCGELPFVSTYLREVPGGVNLNHKYSKCKHTPVADRRRLIWEECKEYLRTKFRF